MTDGAAVRVAIIGAGSWGTALAQILAGATRDVTLWARRPDVARSIASSRHNTEYLPDLELDARVHVTGDIGEALDAAAIAIFAVPTHGMRGVAQQAAPVLPPDAVVVSAAKGFEEATGLTMTAVLGDVLGEQWRRRIAALSGPNIAVEVAAGLPAATVVAGDEETAAFVRDSCTGRHLRFYSTGDCVGVEYGGALKNVVAIAAGACNGMGVGDNGKAAIITRGIAEMTRLGVAAGATPLTFAGLTGLGDCVVTCMSPHSRNRQLGEAIARGLSLDQVQGRTRMVAEGVNATRVAARLARQHGVEVPIADQVNAVLFEGKSVSDALADLMGRDPAEELRGLGGDGLHSTRGSGSSSGG